MRLACCRVFFALSLAVAVPAIPAVAQVTGIGSATALPLAGGEGGLGLDDLTFAPGIGRLVVPAGGTGRLDLFDPATRKPTSVTGLGAATKTEGRRDAGTSSADEGRGLLFANDHAVHGLVVVNPKARTIVARAALAHDADYVRFVAATGEVWVTEPEGHGIEVFSLPTSGVPTPKHEAFIDVPGGAEAMVVDAARGRAYSNLWKTETVAIDLHTRAIVAHYPNSCADSRGLALDARRGFLFVGCKEGKAVVLDLNHEGAVIDRLEAGSGVDIIAFDAALSHLYMPGGKSATMAVLAVSKAGKLTLLGTVATAQRAHCVAVDDRHQVWVCDPPKGQILVWKDELPASL